MKKIFKAVIPAAGMGTRFLPITKSIPKEMLPILNKPAIHYVVQEAIDAGIEEILIITNENKPSIEKYFKRDVLLEESLKLNSKFDLLERIKPFSNFVKILFVNQIESYGLGSAIRCAKDFVNNEPFVVLLPDDIIQNEGSVNATKECIDAFNNYQSTIIGVQEVAKENVSKYGIVKYFNQVKNWVEIVSIVEKPSLKNAPSTIASIGRYIFLPSIFSIIDITQPQTKDGEIEITSSIEMLLKNSKIYGAFITGKRYDTGDQLGYLNCIMDFAIKEKLIINKN